MSAPVPVPASGIAAPGDADWERIRDDLAERGNAIIPRVLSPQQCLDLARCYTDDAAFRSTVVMARYNFGRGEYRYFDYPLPPLVASLRATFYARLAPIANAWQSLLGSARRYPDTLETYLRECHRRGQARPTPLLLRYGSGDYNCLHQDLYGEEVFPLQVAVLLNTPGEDFSGGEFVLTEQRPRMQSRAEVVPLQRGDGVVFAVRERPVAGKRGHYRVIMRHGVSRVRSGSRMTLGIIFHDAK